MGPISLGRFFFILCFVLPAGALADEDGGWSSSGGDPLLFYFEEAREYAADLIRRVDVDELSKEIEPEIRDFIVSHRTALADEVEANIVDWVADGSQRHCSQTANKMGAPITLVYEKCRSTATIEEAGKVLIHENVHHFQKATDDDEHKEYVATWVAIELVAAWERGKLRAVPHCPSKSVPIAKSIFGSWTLDANLTKRMNGTAGNGIAPKGELTLREDVAMLKKFRGVGRCALTGGTMRLVMKKKVRNTPFLVVLTQGRPEIVTFLKDDDNSRIRRWNATLAEAQANTNDLLFFGERVSGEALSVYSRK